MRVVIAADGGFKMTDLNLENIKFLIVDDNKHMRTIVRSVLYALKVRHIKEAVDGADAFLVMKAFIPDIIICDWKMEPLDGLDFVRLVRHGNDSPDPYLPVVFLTGHTEMARVTEARDAGIDEFVAKPVSAHRLYRRIDAIVMHRRPFVRTHSFFGPDRRRRGPGSYRGPERRADTKTAAVVFD